MNDQMSNLGSNSESADRYDLADRTTSFGEMVVRFAKKVPLNVITSPLISQFVRSGTSVGANYCEADDADTKKDFLYKIGVCKREAKETKYWLQMIAGAEAACKTEARKLWHEAKELHLIFAAIGRNGKR
jgi:four helix bundle protein